MVQAPSTPAPSHRGSTTACIFCDRSGPGITITKEHTLPEWLTQLVGPPSPLTGNDFQMRTHRLNSFTGAATTAVKASVPSPSYVPLRAPCSGCNGGWMNDLELRARPIITDIFNGGSPRITPGMQRDLAAWAAKVALMLDAYEPGLSACSGEQYRWMYQHHTPPPDWYVWIGAFAGSPTIGGHHLRLPLTIGGPAPDPGHAPNTANADTIIAGRVVLHVFGSQINFRLPDMPPNLRNQVRQIWPAQAAFSWPPGPTLTLQDAAAMHRAIAGILVGPGRYA